ncbi:MAG TPA: efflux transporter outer membrane subunit [Burkholderiaceae bacterium]|jgi:NodT family efflux transporter outer membrane factor (OMF) lipoprotein
MNKKALPLAVAAASLLLAACTTVGPNYSVPDSAAIKRPAAQANFQQAQKAGAAASLEPLPPQWWQLYRSEELDSLVSSALAANTSLRAAQAHLQRASAQLRQVNGERDPHAGVVAAVKRARESGEAYLLPEQLPMTNEGELMFEVSYQIDLWGQLKRGEEAAEANLEAVEAAQDVARVSVVAQTVQAYLQVCHAQAEKTVAEHALTLQQHTLQLAERMAEAGRGNSTDVLRAQGLVEVQRAGLPRFDAEREAGLYRLAALLGRTPQELDPATVRCATPPQLDQALPVGDGTALLKRRPDVRQAERQAAVASARIGVATASLYPSISIGASAGLIGIAEHLGQPATQTYGLGPLLSWRIPDAGAKARVKMAQADQQAALAQFDGVVLQALAEVETALSRYRHDLERQQAQRDARDRAAALSAEQQRFVAAGRHPYASSLEARRTLIGAESALAAVDADVAQDQVRVFLALGGGWETQSGR